MFKNVAIVSDHRILFLNQLNLLFKVYFMAVTIANMLSNFIISMIFVFYWPNGQNFQHVSQVISQILLLLSKKYLAIRKKYV